jgi:hypothetical protein
MWSAGGFSRHAAAGTTAAALAATAAMRMIHQAWARC